MLKKIVHFLNFQFILQTSCFISSIEAGVLSVAPQPPNQQIPQFSNSTTPPIPFLLELKNKILAKKQANLPPGEIARQVIREVVTDQAIFCLNWHTNVIDSSKNMFTRTGSQTQFNGIVYPSPDADLYKIFLEKVQKAIGDKNPNGLGSTFNRPTEIIPVVYGPVNNFYYQANITIINAQSDFCFIRFALPSNQVIPPSKEPAKTTTPSIKEAVALKVEEKLIEQAAPADIQKAVSNDIDVDESIVCVAQVPLGYFKIQNKVGSDGIVTQENERNAYKRTFESISKGTDLNTLLPETYEVKDVTLTKKFTLYPVAIDRDNVCYARILVEKKDSLTATSVSTTSSLVDPTSTTKS